MHMKDTFLAVARVIDACAALSTQEKLEMLVRVA
jgi:hypothetical protein